VSPVIECRSLVAGHGRVPVVRALDLAVESGSVLSVLGPNGAGKTTLLETLAGLLCRLGGDVFEIRVVDGGRLDDAAAVLTGLHGDRPTIDRDDRRIGVPAREGAASLVAGVRALDEAGVVVDDIALRRPSLDDVFLTLTRKGVAA
jgi:energy-coupling factor transporter ATP-binding protein EcfA2